MKKTMGVILAVATMLHAKTFYGQVAFYNEGPGLTIYKTDKGGGEWAGNFLRWKSGASNASAGGDVFPAGVLVYGADQTGREQTEIIITAGTNALAPTRLELHLVLSGTGHISKAYAYLYKPKKSCPNLIVPFYTSTELENKKELEDKCVFYAPIAASSGKFYLRELTVRGKEASIKGELKSANFKDKNSHLDDVNFGFSIEKIALWTPENKPIYEYGLPSQVREPVESDDSPIDQRLKVTQSALFQNSTLDSR